jgi:hypothetical protein
LTSGPLMIVYTNLNKVKMKKFKWVLLTWVVSNIVVYLLWSFVVMDMVIPLKISFQSTSGRFFFLLSQWVLAALSLSIAFEGKGAKDDLKHNKFDKNQVM